MNTNTAHDHHAAPAPGTSARKAAALRIVMGLSAVLAAVGVFFAYLDPNLMVSLANAVWSCF